MRRSLFVLIVISLALCLTSCSISKNVHVSPIPGETPISDLTPAPSPELPDTPTLPDDPGELIKAALSVDELEALKESFLEQEDYPSALAAVERMIELEPSDDLYLQRAEIQILAIKKNYDLLNAILEQDIERITNAAAYKKKLTELYENAGLRLIIPFVPDYLSEDEINKAGNFSVNTYTYFWKGSEDSSDAGVFSSQGEWIYFAESSEGFSLRKAKLDGSDNRMVCSDWVANINVIGEWIYYVNRGEGNPIYRIRTDGTDRTMLSPDACGGLCVLGDYVYYINLGAGGEIYRMKTDGSLQEPYSKPASAVFSDGEYLYFTGPEAAHIARIEPDSGEIKVLIDSEQRIYRVQIAQDAVYYETDRNGMAIVRIPFESGESEEVYLSEGKLSSFVIAGSLLIASERAPDESESVIIYDLNATDLLYEIKGASSDSVCVASDGGVYFGNYFDNDKFYRIDLNTGTAEKIT